MYRQDGWSFESSNTKHWGDTFQGYAYTEELAGPGGMAYHFWLPPGLTKDELTQLEHDLWEAHDVVSCTWEPMTAEVREFLYGKKMPKGYINADVEKLGEWLDKERALVKVWWGPGLKNRLTIDLFSLSALFAVYRALNETNQQKMKRMIETSPYLCTRAIHFSFEYVK